MKLLYFCVEFYCQLRKTQSSLGNMAKKCYCLKNQLLESEQNNIVIFISVLLTSLSLSLSLLRYLVVKGTPQKMLEYLLTLDIDPGGPDGKI